MAARAAASLKIFLFCFRRFILYWQQQFLPEGEENDVRTALLILVLRLRGQRHKYVCVSLLTRVILNTLTSQLKKTERRAKNDTKGSSLLLTSLGKSLVKGAYKNLAY